MNNWQNEYMAEYERQRIWEEIEQIRLEKLALRSRAYRPGIFARTMFNFANWMISTGKQLRKRYTRSSPVDEVPVVNCSKPATDSFAR
jgi:hypothetical protein